MEQNADRESLLAALGGMSRRKFIAATAFGAGGLVLGACGGDDGDGSSESMSGDDASVTTAAESGGSSTTSLRVGTKSIIEGLTPFAIQGYPWQQALGYLLYDSLTTKDEFGNLIPGLATEWDTTDPTKTILKIREGVTFHDGTPLKAADVAYSIAARADGDLITETSGRPIMTPDQFVSAIAVDDYTVEVTTTERVEFLADPQPVLVVPEDSFGRVNWANEALGTGPFKLVDFVAGSNLDVAANPDYWDGKPPIDDLSIVFFADGATAATGLRSGRVDALYDVAPAEIDAVSDIDGTTVSSSGTYSFWWIPQMGKEPLDDPEVRRALRYAFDNEAINNAAFRGNGLPHSWNPFALYPENSGVDADVEYNPERTREILADLGKSDISIPILVIAGYPDALAAAQVMQQGFQAAGITSEIEVAEAGDWLDRTYVEGTWEGLAFNAGNVPAPVRNYYDYMVNPATLLSAYTEGDVVPKAADLYGRITSTPFDAPEMRALLDEAEALIVEDALALMGLGAPVSLVLPVGLSGVRVNGFGDVFFNKATFG